MRRNVLANGVGQVWSGLLALVSIPLYLHFLGVEAYGLVAFFASLQAVLAVLDLGLGTTANREVARRLPDPHAVGEMRDLIRTFEAVYVLVGMAIASAIVLSANWLMESWIRTDVLSPQTVVTAIAVFGISLGVRWPISLYTGVLLGAERQVKLNIAVLAISTARTGGAILVLAFIAPTVLAYLFWFLAITGVELGVMAALAWTTLPSARGRSAIRPRLLQGVWGFSVSVGGNSLLAAFLKQSDRLIITKLLPLAAVGYYSAAHAAAGGLSMLVRPVATAALPRFTALLATDEEERLSSTYHRLSQLVAAVVAPAAAVLICFAYDILLLWTQSADVAANAATTFAVFGYANLLNAMMQLPFALQLAAGITWIALVSNAIAVALLLPLMFGLIERFGIAGAGISWAVFNTAYYLIIPHVMHRYVLPGHMRSWFLRDTLPFMVSALVLGGGVWLLRETGAGVLAVVLAVIVAAVIYGILAIRLCEPIATTLNKVWAGSVRPGRPLERNNYRELL